MMWPSVVMVFGERLEMTWEFGFWPMQRTCPSPFCQFLGFQEHWRVTYDVVVFDRLPGL